MKHHDIAGNMPGLKYEVGRDLDELSGMVDELAICPAGHERAGHLAQQIKSKIDHVVSAIDRVQPDQDGAPVQQTSADERDPAVNEADGSDEPGKDEAEHHIETDDEAEEEQGGDLASEPVYPPEPAYEEPARTQLGSQVNPPVGSGRPAPRNRV